MKRAQEVDRPRLPVGFGAADRALCLTQRQIAAFLAVLDDAFKRGVGDVGIPPARKRRSVVSVRDSLPLPSWNG